MVLLGEHEAEAHFVQQFAALVRVLGDVHAEGLLDVCRTARGRGGAVAVFRDLDAAGRRHQCGGRGNIETVGPVAAGADDLEDVIVGLQRGRVFPHGSGTAGDLRGGLGLGTLRGQGGEERGVLGRAGPPAHDLVHNGIGLVIREVLFVDDLHNGFFDHGSSLLYDNVMKFFKMVFPSGVRMDSGWNCRP